MAAEGLGKTRDLLRGFCELNVVRRLALKTGVKDVGKYQKPHASDFI